MNHFLIKKSMEQKNKRHVYLGHVTLRKKHASNERNMVKRQSHIKPR